VPPPHCTPLYGTHCCTFAAVGSSPQRFSLFCEPLPKPT
jgi:hypothetical protein